MEQSQRLDDLARTMSIIIDSKINAVHQKIELVSRFPTILANRLQTLNQSLVHANQMLNSLSYKNVLQRGYAIVRDESGAIISTATATPSSIEFMDGTIKL